MKDSNLSGHSGRDQRILDHCDDRFAKIFAVVDLRPGLLPLYTTALALLGNTLWCPPRGVGLQAAYAVFASQTALMKPPIMAFDSHLMLSGIKQSGHQSQSAGGPFFTSTTRPVGVVHTDQTAHDSPGGGYPFGILLPKGTSQPIGSGGPGGPGRDCRISGFFPFGAFRIFLDSPPRISPHFPGFSRDT